jgi:hypothetical protein
VKIESFWGFIPLQLAALNLRNKFFPELDTLSACGG